ncbi:beta strand repeat-containing protein, partial [Flavobacterium sp. ZT3R25]|uniref:beta strand repeat-containing protein n=1 Tax=Flavobacterium galactosi TaxID=3398735 RepID=UPI003A8B8F81
MKSIFTYSTKLFSLFLISFLSISTAVAQTAVPNPNTSCTSGDLELVGATLTGGDLCNSCPTNTILTRTLTLSINNTTGSTRTSFAFWGNLEEYSGINGSLVSTIAISGCGGPLPGHTITSLTFDQVSYTCGNTLKITNLFLAWTDASPGSICPLNPATISPKCGKLPLIKINAGVNGEFVLTNSQCGTANGNIDLTPIGGTAPYTYSWTTLDGVIPNGQEDDQDLINVVAGTFDVMITDANGCTITKSRTITASPPTVASFAQVSDITAACGAATTSTLNYTNSSTGNCLMSGSVTSTLSSQSPTGSCGGNITESWTFTDNYSRTIIASRIIHVSPAALPTMTAPVNITVACGSIPAPSTINFSNGLSGGCLISGTSNPSTFSATPNACGGTVTETWTATDICGRIITTVSRTITVSPATLPIMSAPATITVTCGAIPAPSTISFSNGLTGGCLISGTSNLSTFSLTPNACGGTVTETWAATDICGRTVTAVSRTITVSPASLPTMTAPGNITVACGSVPAASTITFSNGLNGGCLISGTSNLSTFSATPNACGGTVTETWTATDICGRTVTAVSRTITVSPAALPTMTAPGNITVACGSIPAPSTITFSNGLSGACLISGISNPSTFSATPSACGGTVTQTWTATDICGRTIASVSRIITVTPAALPTMAAPSNITVACGSIPAPSTINFSNGLSGGCLISGTSNPSSFSSTPNSCGGTVTETWTGTDTCGRTVTTVSRTITVSPAVLPTMTAPATITVTCGAIPAPSTISFSNGLTGGCLISGTSNPSTFTTTVSGYCKGQVIETWNATDICGRALASVSRTITIDDKTLPTFTPPLTSTIYKDANCNYNADPNITGNVNDQADNCTNKPDIIVSHSDTSCFGTQQEWNVNAGNGILIDFNVEGFDGQPASAVKNITLSFNTNQGIGHAEITLVSPQGQAIILVGPYCSDPSCSIDGAASYTPVFYGSGYPQWNNVNNPTGAGNYTPLGGTSTNSQYIPEFNGYISNFSEFTGEMNGTWRIFARKQSTENGTLNINNVCFTPSEKCANDDFIVRHWAVSDACGNTKTADQIILIKDNMAPVITSCAHDQTIPADLNCKALVPDFTSDITATDNCTPSASLIITQFPLAGTEVRSGTTTITLTVKDACGKETSCEAKLIVTNYIVANDDAGTTINGYTGGISFTNVLANDLLNCIAVSVNDVNLSIISSINTGITVSGTNVVVAPGTPTGNYTLTYEICEKLNPTNCDTGIVTVTVYIPSITLLKDGTYVDTNNDGITNVGDTINYSFVVTNSGSSTLSNVTVTDINAAVTGGPIASLTVDASDSTTFSAVHAITQEDIDTGFVYNLATATGTPPSGPNVTGSSSDPTPCTSCPVNPKCPDCTITTLTQTPSIAITKDGTYVDANNDGITNIGDTVIYNFAVTNTGNVTLTNVTVTDTNAVVTGGPIASLAVNASDSTTFSAVHTITQADINTGFVYNLATATGIPPSGPNVTDTSSDPTPCTSCPVNPECPDCTITPLTQTPSIAITKDGTYVDANNDGITNIGDTVIYNFAVANTGNVTLNNITVTDINAVVTVGPIASLTVGTSDSTTFSAVHAITQADINTGFVNNLATATGTPPSGPNVTDTSSDPTPCTSCPVNPECPDCTITPLTQTPSIAITKDGTYVDANNDGITNIGDTVIYNFVVANTGNVTVNNITVTDINAVVTGGPIASLTVGASDSTTFSAVH